MFKMCVSNYTLMFHRQMIIIVCANVVIFFNVVTNGYHNLIAICNLHLHRFGADHIYDVRYGCNLAEHGNQAAVLLLGVFNSS